jgi:SnoaL-like domain
VRRGKDVIKGMFEHCAALGVRATVDHLVAGQQRAAATITCEFPGGRQVVANSILDVEDGRIIRERDVHAGDPER